MQRKVYLFSLVSNTLAVILITIPFSYPSWDVQMYLHNLQEKWFPSPGPSRRPHHLPLPPTRVTRAISNITTWQINMRSFRKRELHVQV